MALLAPYCVPCDSGQPMTWQLLVVVSCVLTPLAWACLWIARRPRADVTAMPAEPDPPAGWPLSGGDGGAAVPYLRGGSHAAGLSGRR